MWGAKPVPMPFIYCAGTAAIFTVFFLAVPEVDLRVSAWFGTLNGFPLSDSLILKGVRAMMLVATAGVAFSALIMLILGTVSEISRAISARFLIFVLTCSALGPGLIVNGFVKRVSGRVRPRNTDIFGGEGHFSAFMDFSGTCGSNCSFVSAEASAIATFTTILLIVIIPHIRSSMRATVRTGVLCVAVGGSFLRIVVGAHYLSDVVFSWLIICPIVFGLHIAFGFAPHGSSLKRIIQPPNENMPNFGSPFR